MVFLLSLFGSETVLKPYSHNVRLLRYRRVRLVHSRSTGSCCPSARGKSSGAIGVFTVPKWPGGLFPRGAAYCPEGSEPGTEPLMDQLSKAQAPNAEFGRFPNQRY